MVELSGLTAKWMKASWKASFTVTPTIEQEEKACHKQGEQYRNQWLLRVGVWTIEDFREEYRTAKQQETTLLKTVDFS